MCEDVQETFPARQKESAHCGIPLPEAHAHPAAASGLPEQSAGFHNSSQSIIIAKNKRILNIERKNIRKVPFL